VYFPILSDKFPFARLGWSVTFHPSLIFWARPLDGSTAVLLANVRVG
jgi:hypothetical protein